MSASQQIRGDQADQGKVYTIGLPVSQWLDISGTMDNETYTEAVEGDPHNVVELGKSVTAAGIVAITTVPRRRGTAVLLTRGSDPDIDDHRESPGVIDECVRVAKQVRDLVEGAGGGGIGQGSHGDLLKGRSSARPLRDRDIGLGLQPCRVRTG